MNTRAITSGEHRVCDFPPCTHTTKEHERGGKCTKCNCPQLHLRRDRIYMRYGTDEHPIFIGFKNCLERLCACGTETTIRGYKIEKITPKSNSSDKMAIHICSECSLISYYDVDISFESYLGEQLHVRFEDAFKELEY